MKKSRKAQVTIFVIIAILIVAGIVLFFYVKNKTSSLTLSIPSEIQPVYNYARACIEKAGYEAVNIVGPLGGYCNFEDYLVDKVNYYSLNNKSIAPSREIIEREISSYVEAKLENCFDKPNLTGFEINLGKPNVNTKISNEAVNINVEYPLSIKKGNSNFVLKNFGTTNIKIRLGLIHQIALNITDIYLRTGSFSLTYASDIGDSTGIRFLYQYYPDYTLVYINDERGIKEEMPYAFRFALR